MTCIIALVQNGISWMGADSSSGNGILGPNMSKIWTQSVDGNEWMLGGAGTARVIQLLQYTMDISDLKPGSNDDLLIGFLIRQFIPRVKDCLDSAGMLKHEDVGPCMSKSGLLLIVRNHIFEITPNFMIREVYEPFAAIGSGGPEAHGVLWVTEAVEPRQRILKALEVAERYNDNVRRPFKIIPD